MHFMNQDDRYGKPQGSLMSCQCSSPFKPRTWKGNFNFPSISKILLVGFISVVVQYLLILSWLLFYVEIVPVVFAMQHGETISRGCVLKGHTLVRARALRVCVRYSALCNWATMRKVVCKDIGVLLFKEPNASWKDGRTQPRWLSTLSCLKWSGCGFQKKSCCFFLPFLGGYFRLLLTV